jgi:multiple sugar transport system permease protein
VALFPLFYSLILSFFDWNLQSAARPFVWFQNYGTVLSTPRMWQALARSLGVATIAVGLEFLLGIGLALLLTDEFPGKGLTVIIAMTPLMMAPVVVGQVWRMLWDTRFGAINDLLGKIVGGSQFIPWLGDTKLALLAIITTDVWQWTPFIMLIALAGFSAVNVELYEAAAIDGATRWQAFWRITLPVIRPVLLVAFLFRMLDALKLFDIVFVLTLGGPGYSTETFPYYIYQQGFQYGRFSYAAAASYIFLIIVVVLSQTLIRRIGEV